MKNDVPFSRGYLPMGIIRAWPALRKSRCIGQVSVQVPVDEEIISAWKKLLEGDEGQGRPMARCPSVPPDSSQLAPQLASCVDNGFDLSITSFPLMCLSPDGSRLCPSIAESTPSVPPFSLSRTLQTRSAALSRFNTASLVQEARSSQLDIRFPFLLDQSLLKVPFLIGCTK